MAHSIMRYGSEASTKRMINPISSSIMTGIPGKPERIPLFKRFAYIQTLAKIYVDVNKRKEYFHD